MYSYSQPGHVSKKLKSDNTRFASATPYLTSKTGHIEQESVFNFQTNSSVRITHYSRTTDQILVNENQLVFMDVSDYDKSRLLSLAQLNWFLVNDAPAMFEKSERNFRNAVRVNGKIVNRDQCEKDMLLQRFRFIGAMTNHDRSHTVSMTPSKRVSTLTVHGYAPVFDYWSYDRNMVKQKMRCFFVLKKVKLPKDVNFQFTISKPNTIRGIRPSGIDTEKLYWQVIPYCGHEKVPPVSEYSWSIPTKKVNPANKSQHALGRELQDECEMGVGGYWHVGYIIETNLVREESFSRRERESVGRDISFLYDAGCNVPLEFYLKPRENFIY